MLRTHTCGELIESFMGKSVTLCGWVHKRRDHGELIFVDLRDAYGITQLVFDPKEDRLMHDKAHELRAEYVIKAEGIVRERPEGTKNTKIKTGGIEILVMKLDILNESLTPPFELDNAEDVSEDTRLKYRYIDLRRPSMQKIMRLRSKINHAIRQCLEKENFVEIETPFLTRSTPEGARDFLVPSRLSPGKFYALPQSPQLFKQILMVSGADRYFQIVRCFRDEDLRRDRQPEFTQLDMEMSFVEEEDIFRISEGVITNIFKAVTERSVSPEFRRLKYSEAMERFGSDKPDTRFGMELKPLSDIVKGSKFNVFNKVLDSGGAIYAINIKGGAGITRSGIDALTEEAKNLGAGGLAYFKSEKGGLASNIDKFFEKDMLALVKERLRSEEGDLILIVADKKKVALEVLGALRLALAKKNNLIDEKKFEFLWITDFPLFKYNEQEQKWDSEHHPFTACAEEDAGLLDTDDLGKIRARSYDLVINGSEIASGSVRIHSRETQEKIFKIIGLDPEEANKRFGFLLEAFKYGAPPHGGIAFGLDRFTTLFTGSQSIRDVIAFPKTQKGLCLMTEAPSDVDEGQLKELNIKKIGGSKG